MNQASFNSAGSTHFAANISNISFSANSSVKPPTFQKVALQLVDEFALNGFLSKEEPVQVWLPASAADGGPFALNLIKGAARCHTLQALLLYLFIMNRPVNSTLPILFASLTSGLTLVAPLVNPNLEMIAFRNAQFGQRGAIRKALDIFSWVEVLKQINASSIDDAAKAITKWNQTYATKYGKLTGNKRMAVLALLNAPSEDVDAILQCLARVGADNAPVTEEAIGNNKNCTQGMCGDNSNYRTGRSFCESPKRVYASCAATSPRNMRRNHQ